MALNLPFVAPGGPTVPGRGTPLRSRLSALSCPHPTCVRKRQKRRRPVPVVRMSSENPEPDIDEDGDADDVVSRRVFSAGILATGTFALVNAVNLFGGDEFKREFAAPFRKLLPALFPASGELGAERSKLDREFAAYYYGQHAIVADQMHIISRADLEEGERELLAKSRPLFFPADGPGDSLDMYDQMKMYNYKLYARVHTIATRTSPAGRLDFSRALGKVLLAKILSAKSVPYPVAMRRDPRSPVAAAEWMEVSIESPGALQCVAFSCSGRRQCRLPPCLQTIPFLYPYLFGGAWLRRGCGRSSANWFQWDGSQRILWRSLTAVCWQKRAGAN